MLSCKRWDRIHDDTSLTQSDKRPCRSSVQPRYQKPNVCASLALRCGWKFLIWIKRIRSVMYNRNMVGPRTNPCRTPNNTYSIFHSGHTWCGRWGTRPQNRLRRLYRTQLIAPAASHGQITRVDNMQDIRISQCTLRTAVSVSCTPHGTQIEGLEASWTL